jgi:Rhodopirellula transposase DDE domain
MESSAAITAIRTKFQLLQPLMTERLRRQWAACEAQTLGRGGVSWVAQATGLSRTTITTGQHELGKRQRRPQADLSPERIRAPGAGRPALVEVDAQLRRDLPTLLEASTRGDPESPLLWTTQSTRHLAEALGRLGHTISHTSVAALLDDWGYSLQANRKTKEGQEHPDRDAQFGYINQRVRAFQRQRQPVISVDAKNKENIGDFKRSGRTWRPQGQPEKVRAKDFPDKQLGKVVPEGVYDLTRNEGWVSVGIDHDTAELAGVTIARWWRQMGARVYPHAERLLITADAGGSSGYRPRLWKVVVQRLADQLGLKISVCHFPPGTSKWNKIEHRMFSQITENWRGRPLRTRAMVVNLIAHTKTRTGLKIRAEWDTNHYETGIEVSEKELAALRLTKDSFHGEWNYTISPHGET